MGDQQTPYLRLNFGTDTEENQNWAKLDGRLLQLARGIFANIPAGGDLTGYYPDPTIALGVITPQKLKAPIGASGQVLTLDATGAFVWTTSAAGANPWSENAAQQRLIPTSPPRAIYNVTDVFFGTSLLTGVGISTGQLEVTYATTMDIRDAQGGTTAMTFGTSGVTVAADPTVALGIATKQYVDTRAVPTAGTTNQVLTKNSAANYDVSWKPVPAATNGLPTGGTLNQILTKNSGTNYDASWKDPTAAAQLWTDDVANSMLVPSSAGYGVALPSLGNGLVIRHSTYPTINRRTGIDADDNTLLVHGGALGTLFKTWDSASVLAYLTNGGTWRLGDSTAATERLELATGGIMVATALGTADGTIQYTAGHFQGRVAGVWTQLDNAAAVTSPWTEDANAIYPVNQTKPVGMGVATMTTTGVRLDVATAQQITNGESTILIENTAALNTNQKVGYRIKHPGLDLYCVTGGVTGVGGTNDYGLVVSSPIGNSNFAIQELSSSGFTKINAFVKEFNGSTIDGSNTAWMPFCKGWYGPYAAGASTVGPADVRSMQWAWPPWRPGQERRHYRISLSGSIARAAGQAGVRIVFGLATGPSTIFDYVSGPVTWTSAQFWIEVHINAGIGSELYNVQMRMMTDPASTTAATVCATYMSKGSLSASMSTSAPQMKLQANFDTSNAGNNVTLANWLFELLPINV